jgi:FAD:protein FMN transferase
MIVQLAAFAMGTRIECILQGDREDVLRAAGEEALDEIRRWESLLSAFRTDSIISRINAEAFERPVRVDTQTFALLALCEEVWRASGGAFDPTIGPLMRAWGFCGDAVAASPPDLQSRLAAARALVGFDKLVLDAERLTIRALAPGVTLDLGAVGKGFALDRAGEVLRDCLPQASPPHDPPAALLHAGTSSVLAIGAPPATAGFRIAVAHPPPQTGSWAEVTLRDSALGVSAPHGRTQNDAEGRSVGHVLDPRTGEPTRAARGVAVVGPSAALCDAWSTAALVLGERPPDLPDGYACHVLAAHD